MAQSMIVTPAEKAVLDLVASVEAPNGYDTVYNNQMHRMPKPLTSMTFDEVVLDGPRRTREFGSRGKQGSSACGRYQFMRDTLDKPKTLADLKGELALSGDEIFSPALQDFLGAYLLKRRGFDKFLIGAMSMTAFGNNLAREWASFPVLSAVKGQKRRVARGETFYAGDALNKVLLKPEQVERLLRSVLASVGAPVVKTPPPRKPVTDRTAVAEPTPEVAYVPAPVAAPKVPFWARWIGAAKPAVSDAKNRPGLKPGGDPALWDVQDTLKRLGYEPILRDGLNGDRTRNAVRTARRRNGMPAGEEVDAVFRAALPGLLPAMVSKTRNDADTHEMEQQSPDLFSAFKGLKLPGILGTVATVAGAASDAGLMDQIKGAVDQGSQTLGQIQAVLSAVFAVGAWLYAHWWVVAAVVLLLACGRAYIGWLQLRALWRAGRVS